MNNCKCMTVLVQESPGLAVRLAHRLLGLNTQQCGLCRAAQLREQRNNGISAKEQALRAAARDGGLYPL